jgi:hypothetical protein
MLKNKKGYLIRDEKYIKIYKDVLPHSSGKGKGLTLYYTLRDDKKELDYYSTWINRPDPNNEKLWLELPIWLKKQPTYVIGNFLNVAKIKTRNR